MLEFQKCMSLFFHIYLSDLKSQCNQCSAKSTSGIKTVTFKYITKKLFSASLLRVVHVLLAGKDITTLYAWNSEANQFSVMLEAPYADHITSVTARSLNTSKSLIALSANSSSQIYELTTISNQSDFIPR